MIRRKPHVFSNTVENNEHEMKENWQTIKAFEREQAVFNSRLDKIPKSSTSLVTAEQLQKEAAKVGFDWQDPEPVLDKIKEEQEELTQAVAGNEMVEIEEEIGDLIFYLVYLVRIYGAHYYLS